MEPKHLDNLTFTSDSEEEIHPNIDKRSYLRWKRMQRNMEKEQMRNKVKELECLEQTEEIKSEIKKLRETIEPIRDYIETEGNKNVSDISNKENNNVNNKVVYENTDINKENKSSNTTETIITQKNDEEVDYAKIIIYFVENNNIKTMIDFLDNNDIDIHTLYDNILYNLSENIKSGYTEASKALARIAYYLKYGIGQGRGFLKKLELSMRNKKYKESIEKDIDIYYNEVVDVIINKKYE
ncbi:hypothetical protein SLOPH_1744 [Spraguea lophii 42_110]|uniref:Cdc37 N-terminal domain-containing protein n=1 Tax=Spraguea lophii (strain 42_110) TaxID=1358809 RepID=S7W8I8_SPRLO|nr:hypothetical protein SLOPH_1744 [Spraguea lophii 42_110]